MDAGLLRGLFTVLMVVLFVGIWVWAWSGRRKADFDQAARLPLEGDDKAPPQEMRQRAPQDEGAKRA